VAGRSPAALSNNLGKGFTMRKYRAGLLAAVVAGLLVASGAASSASSPAELNSADVLCKRVLDQTQRGFDKAFNDRDAHRLAGFYHKDATLINPFGSLRNTPATIEAAFTGLFSSTFLSTVTPVDQSVQGCRTAVVISDFLLTDPADNSKLHFLASLTYTFERGRWQVLLDQSTNLPVT
jgi:ketosteroid isomerase-like protein